MWKELWFPFQNLKREDWREVAPSEWENTISGKNPLQCSRVRSVSSGRGALNARKRGNKEAGTCMIKNHVMFVTPSPAMFLAPALS